MTQSEINEIFDKTIAASRAVLCSKADEYVGKGDRLSNFKHAAHLQNLTLPAALGGMMSKHTVSVYDMIYRYQNGEKFSQEKWDEKIGDHINYLILLQAVLAEERNESAAHESGKDINVPATHAPIQTAGPAYTCGDCRYIHQINASEETACECDKYYLCISKRSHNGIVTPDTPACSVCEPCGKIQ
jgi:hypothetical protein